MNVTRFRFVVYGMILWGVASMAGAVDAFQRGGVTYPMEEISQRRFSSNVMSQPNLLDNRQFVDPMLDVIPKKRPWTHNSWIFHRENRDRFSAAADKLGRASIMEVDGGKAMRLYRPIELEELMGAKASAFSLRFRQVVRLPDTNGGTYRLTMDAQNKIIGKTAHVDMVLIWFKDGSDPRPEQGKETRRYLFNRIPDNPQWHLHSLDFQVPEQTRDLILELRADGCGDLLLRNPKLVKLASCETPLTVELAPGKLLDNTVALASGDPGIINVKFRNNLDKGTLPPDHYFLNLELPADIMVKGTNTLLGKEFTHAPLLGKERAFNRWQIPSDAVIPTIRNSKEFQGWATPAILVQSRVAAGTLWKDCRYYVTREDKTVSNVEHFAIRMIPAIPKVSAPKQFLTGFSTVRHDLNMQQPEAQQLLASFIAQTGTNLLAFGGTPEMRNMLRKQGIDYLTSEAYYIANGFRLGHAAKDQKPQDSFYLDKDGKPVMDGGTYATCPTAIYTKSAYFKDVFKPQLAKTVEGLDGIQPNWEPYYYIAKGCYCPRCRDEFARFAKLSPEKVKDIWPAQILPGYPYRDLAIRFRAYQHAKLIQTIQEEMRALGATKIGFCPEVGTDQIIRYPNHFQEQWEYTPYEYAGELNWLNVWGPYVWINATQPYTYTKGERIQVLERAKRVIRDYRKHFKDSRRRAKLMAMPHGSQGDITNLGQPEGLAMDQLSSFLAGYDASELYFFPRGYDHRYWQALAQANQQISDHEQLVMNGDRTPTDAVTPVTPFPAPIVNIDPGMMPDLKKTDLLQVLSFNKPGKRLVAIGNFWEKGDVVCKLVATGLEPETRYQVYEKTFNRTFVDENGQSFTGTRLAQGILVHVGAIRWAFFDITPAADAAPGIPVTPSQMGQLKQTLNRENLPAQQDEARRDQALHAEHDIGELKTLKSGTLVCKPVERNGKTLLEISQGEALVLVNPRGLVVDSWTFGDRETVASETGKSAFWAPGKLGMVAEVIFHITEQTMTPEGIRLTGELVTTERTYPQLPKLKLIKTIDISKDLKSIAFKVRLHNLRPESMNTVGYRWYMSPIAWHNRYGGTIAVAGKTLKRPHAFSLLKGDCDPGIEQVVRRLFQVKQASVPIEDHVFSMVASPAQRLSVSCLPQEAFAGVAIWDTPDMVSATFEPFYRSAVIAPQGDLSFQLNLQVLEP